MINFNIASLSEEEIKDFELDTPASKEENTKLLDLEKEKAEKAEKSEKEEETPKSPVEKVGSFFEEDEEEEEEKNEEDEEDEEGSGNPKNKKELQFDYFAYYKTLVDKGIWEETTDANGKPLEDLSEEDFQSLAIEQAEWKIQSEFEKRESEYGSEYKELVEYLKNGGKIEDLSKFNSEIFDIENLDPSNESDAEKILRAHYSNVSGFSEKRINSMINSFKDEGEDSLQEAAQESKDFLINSLKEEKSLRIEEQKRIKKENDQVKERFVKSLKEQIYSDKISDKEKKEIEKFYFDYKNPIEGGLASDFYKKYKEIQANPKNFYKLVKFIKNIEEFEEKEKTEKKEKRETIKLLREAESFNNKSSFFPEKEKQQKVTKAPTLFKKRF